MKIYTDTPEGVTVIQNSFIDQYMPHANGEFVKVYLYLLRCANTGRDLSLSSIADVFEHTEKDVGRALTYWEKQGLIRLSLSPEGRIISATFADPAVCARGITGGRNAASCGDTGSSTTPAGASRRRTGKSAQPGSQPRESAQPKEPAADIGQLSTERDRQNLRQLFFIAEQYLQRPLSSSEQSDFVYYYDTLHFSADLIEYLIEYCISKGSASRHYMKKVALAWAEAGITTVLQAKQETNLYNKNYFTIMNAFGIKGRNPALPEQELMSRWLNEFCFSLDIILEACRRTICQTHQPNFQYADKILEQWHAAGVTSMSDIEQLDLKRLKEQKKTGTRPQRTSGNRFNNFSQRDYDYSELEKQLLGQ